jgi:transcriptional regulator with XRE-family HTH domain
LIYHELLKKAVGESGWSMREISRRCKEKGVGLSQGYLSQLCRKEVPPASDKANTALGEVLSLVTDLKPEELIVASYREKIPSDVLEVIAHQHVHGKE